MTIGRIGTEQLDRLEELETLCFEAPWSRESLRLSVEDPLQRWFGCYEGEKLIGYASVQCVAGDGYIGNVAVDPAYRRGGAGSALVKALSELAARQSLGSLMLEVRLSNESAIALYEGEGYERVGFRPNYYESPREGAVLMTKFFITGEKK